MLKDLNLIVWLSQLGLTVAMPLCGFVFLGVWLHKSVGWGSWVLWLGIALGIYCAISGFVSTLRTLSRMGEDKKEKDTDIEML